MLIFGNLVNCIYMLNHVKLMLPDAPGNNSSPCKDTRRVRAFLRKEGRLGWRRLKLVNLMIRVYPNYLKTIIYYKSV